MSSLALIGAAIGCGAQRIETELGPQALQQWQLAEKLRAAGLDTQWATIVPSPEHDDNVQQVSLFCEALADGVQQVMIEGGMPVSIGGDHSMAIGTWSGVTHALQAERDFGLIWIDAHMDAHTFDTSPSNAIHGMPVAVLLGEGETPLVEVASPKPKINPEHLVMIGIRSFESGEAEFLQSKKVRIIGMEEVLDRGFESVFKEALDIVNRNTTSFGMTIDLDGFDPLDAPGVGTPEGQGLRAAEVLPCLKQCGQHPKFKALEIAEYNPKLDQNMQTAMLVQQIISAVFSKD